MLADLKLDTKQRIGAMSKGTQEKVQLCLTMSRGAKLYLLDEPLGGVDPAAREYILQTILRNDSEDSTVLLSTHLIEEVSGFIGRAVLIRAGRIVGDVSAAQLEEEGRTLMRYIKETYHYQPDRVSRALSELTGEEEEP